MKKDILVPDIGDFEKVEIIEVLVKEGQKIQNNDSIVTLESDKSSVWRSQARKAARSQKF